MNAGAKSPEPPPPRSRMEPIRPEDFQAPPGPANLAELLAYSERMWRHRDVGLSARRCRLLRIRHPARGQRRGRLPVWTGAGEVDLRYHANTGQYTFYRPSRPLQVNTQNPDGTVTPSTQPFANLKYSSRAVTNVAVGASYLVGKALALHAGGFASLSPVGNATLSPFQQADLFALTAGAAFTGAHWSGSLGLAFEFGSSTAVASGDASGQATALDYRSVTLLYAVGYRF